MESDQAFVEMVVKQIVDLPDKVQTERIVDEKGVKITLTVDSADMGKLIGKEGRTAKAIRTLLHVLGAKNNARVSLKIAEPEGGTGGRREVLGVDSMGGDEATQTTDTPAPAAPLTPAPAPLPAPEPVDEEIGTQLI